MKFVGVLVRPLKDQRDRDGQLIDPDGVKFDDAEIPIWRNFSYEMGDMVGRGVVSRAEDGSIVVKGELNAAGASLVGKGVDRLAIGLRVENHIREREREIARESTLFSIALTKEHQDPGQPPIRLLDQWN